jgi:ribosomal subunit interface protein
MDIPVQVTFHGMAASPAIAEQIRERAAKLERFHPHLGRCRAVVEQVGRHQHKGSGYTVRLELKVDGGEVAVSHEHAADAYAAVNEAFDAARRQLEDLARRQRGDVKRRPAGP